LRLRRSTVRTKVVLAQELGEVASVPHEQRDLGIEVTEAPDLSILLRHEPLFENGEFDEEVLFREIEVRTKPAGGNSPFAPRQGELEGFIDPRVSVECQQCGEELLARVSEGLRSIWYHARMSTARTVARR